MRGFVHGSIPVRYAHVLAFLVVLAALAPLVENTVDVARALEVGTSVVCVSVMVELAVLYRQRPRQSIAATPSIFYRLVIANTIWLAGATVIVLDRLAGHESAPTLALWVAIIGQPATLSWCLPMLAKVERERRK